MFGRNKQSHVVDIDSLTRAARETIEKGLMRHYGASRSGLPGAQENNVMKAGAAANFLTGQAPHPTHAGVNLPQVRTEARAWIRNNVEMRELAVQTLRIVARSHSVDTGSDAISEDSSSILSEFGKNLSDAPDPLAYEAAVRRAIATLPHSTQVQLMRLTKA
jgi:hypothetical protein